MDRKTAEQRRSRAQTEDLDRLKGQYQCVSDSVLLKWMQAVTGTHREAMAAVLRVGGNRVGAGAAQPGGTAARATTARRRTLVCPAASGCFQNFTRSAI